MRLEVKFLGLPGVPVIGSLADDARGRIYFEYDAAWRARGIELSPLHLPVSLRGAHTAHGRAYGPLFGLFQDSMPDWWGRQLMRHHFAERHVPWNEVGALDMLACQGAFGMGALAYEPDLSAAHYRDLLVVEVAELMEAARQVLRHHVEVPAITALVRGGLSPGGAQPKALIAANDDFTEVVAGGGEVPSGFLNWLLKLQLDAEDPVGRMEYAITRMATVAGVDVPEIRLVETGHLAHFAVQRFDRQPQERPRHFHSFSGLMQRPLANFLEYGELMNLTRGLTRREADVEQCFVRAIFNIAVANDDDHGRNHAYLWTVEGGWRLAPAYDLTRASNPLGSGLRAAGIAGKHKGLGLGDLRNLARDQGLRKVKAEESIDQVLAALARWPEFAEEAGLSPAHAKMLAVEMPGMRW